MIVISKLGKDRDNSQYEFGVPGLNSRRVGWSKKLWFNACDRSFPAITGI